MTKDRVRRWLLVLVAASLLGGAFGGAVLAEAPEDDDPQVLADAAPVTRALPGSGAGSFDYYVIRYPGGEADVRIQVTFEPQEPAVAAALGFNVYGPDGREQRGDWKADDGYLEVTYQRVEAGDLLVQVYNYSARTVSYTIVAQGLPEAPDARTPTESEPTDLEAPAPADVEEAMSGVVVGNSGGAFGEHTIAYDGSGDEVTVTMTLAPADPSFANAFGVNVYGPSGKRVATAASTDDPAVRKATFATEVAGEYLLQVYNYTDGVALHYWLQVAK